jgi:hypothetical protein
MVDCVEDVFGDGHDESHMMVSQPLDEPEGWVRIVL